MSPVIHDGLSLGDEYFDGLEDRLVKRPPVVKRRPQAGPPEGPRPTTTGHTPGPWRAVNRSADGAEDPHLGWDVEGPPEAVRGQFARGVDARLIAAAPELLEEAKTFIAWLQGTIGSDSELDLATHILKLQVAIAKAERTAP